MKEVPFPFANGNLKLVEALYFISFGRTLESMAAPCPVKT
jgi:hypothetical protein